MRVASGSARRTSRRAETLHVAALVVVGALAALPWVLDVTDWIVMTDELLYTRLAMSVGQTLSPVPNVHGEYFGTLNMLYPLLTSPAWALGGGPAGFRAAHVLNAVLFASTAVPAYLLAREVVRRHWAALLVAALSICIPWAAMTLMILTESAAYPAFVWALLALQRAMARPSVGRDAVALAALGLAFLGRTQFVVLAAVLPVAVLVHEVLYAVARRPEGRWRAGRDALAGTLRTHRLLFAVTALVGLAVGALLVSGRTSSVLGNYAVTAEGALLPPGWAHAAAVYVAFMAVGLGILPLIASLGWSVATLARGDDKAQHAFAVLGLAVVPAMVLQVTSFGLRFSHGTQDRYLFYIAPVLLIGTAACLLSVRRQWPWVLAAAIPSAWLIHQAEFAASPGPFFGSPASAFHVVLSGQSARLGDALGVDALSARTVVTVGALLGAALLAAVLWRLAPRARTVAVLGALLLAAAAQTSYVMDKMLAPSGGRTPAAGPIPADRDWIDDAVADDAKVALVPGTIPTLPDAWLTQSLWWSTELWNERATDALALRSSTFTPFPEHDLRVDSDTGTLTVPRGTDALVLPAADLRFAPRARRTVRSPDDHLSLAWLTRPARAAWTTDKLLGDGWVEGARASVRLYPSGRRERRSVVLEVASAPELRGTRRVAVRAPGGRSADVRVASGRSRDVRLDVCVPAGEPVDVTLAVDRQTRLPDGRIVGVRVPRLAVRPAGSCA